MIIYLKLILASPEGGEVVFHGAEQFSDQNPTALGESVSINLGQLLV